MTNKYLAEAEYIGGEVLGRLEQDASLIPNPLYALVVKLAVKAALSVLTSLENHANATQAVASATADHASATSDLAAAQTADTTQRATQHAGILGALENFGASLFTAGSKGGVDIASTAKAIQDNSHLTAEESEIAARNAAFNSGKHPAP